MSVDLDEMQYSEDGQSAEITLSELEGPIMGFTIVTNAPVVVEIRDDADEDFTPTGVVSILCLSMNI